MSLTQGYSIGRGRHAGTDEQRPWRHIIHGTGYCKRCPSVKTHTGWTHTPHTKYTRYLYLTRCWYSYTNTRNRWQWEFGERRKESAHMMLSVPFKVSKCMLDDSVVLISGLSGRWHLQNIVLFFMHSELKRKCLTIFWKEKSLLISHWQEYSPNPVTRPQPPKGPAIWTCYSLSLSCSTCLKNTWHARANPEVTSEMRPCSRFTGPSSDPHRCLC